MSKDKRQKTKDFVLGFSIFHLNFSTFNILQMLTDKEKYYIFA